MKQNIFGELIDSKSVHWAIENKKITDYNILVIKNTEDEVNEIINRLGLNIINKEIFISCYMCLKSFETYNNLTHLLLYTNTTNEAELAEKYINDILSSNILTFSKEDIYNKSLHSKNCNDINKEVNEFKNKSFGIISCVYIFGEGFDLPKLNGVCIASNMESEIRIVQYILRPNRLDSNNPNKIAYVIIPYVDSTHLEIENKSFQKVRNIISQMRNVDKTIEQKILFNIAKTYKRNIIRDDKEDTYEDIKYEESKEDLKRIKSRLKYSKVLDSKNSEEQDEYDDIRCENIHLKIKSKKEYVEKKNNHRNYIDNPETYFKSKCVWENWYDFLGIDTSIFIQTKDEWIKFCNEKNIKSLDDYNSSCDKYNILPREPGDFYKDFTNITNELKFNKFRRRK
jgi:hypothetical protein